MAIGAAGSGLNFVIGLIQDEEQHPAIITKEFDDNEWNVSYVDGREFETKLDYRTNNYNHSLDFLPKHELKADYTYNDEFYSKELENLNNLSDDFVIMKSHSIPLSFTEEFDVEIETPIVIDCSKVRWFTNALWKIKREFINPHKMGAQLDSQNNNKYYKNKQVMERFHELIMGLNEQDKDFSDFLKIWKKTESFVKAIPESVMPKDCIAAWHVGFYNYLRGPLKPEEAIGDICLGRYKQDVYFPLDEFVQRYPNTIVLDYEEFFFKGYRPNHPVFTNAYEDKIKKYSDINLELVKNLVEYVEHPDKKLMMEKLKEWQQ